MNAAHSRVTKEGRIKNSVFNLAMRDSLSVTTRHDYGVETCADLETERESKKEKLIVPNKRRN